MKKKVLRIVVWVVVIAGLLLTAYILLNNFQILEVMKKLHGG